MQDISLPVAVLLTGGAMLTGVAVAFATTRAIVGTLQERLGKAEARIDQAQFDLASFKLEAAQKFVTDEMMGKLEKRLIDAIDRLGDRLDRAFEARSSRRNPSA